MATIYSNWAITQSAAAEYQRFSVEIDQVRRNTKLFRRGLVSLNAVSPDPARVRARLNRETAHEAWLLGEPTTAFARAQERMMGSQLDLQEACLLEKLVKFSRAVGRLVLPAGQGLGTGWLIGEGLLLTNHHVLPNATVAQGSSLIMGYERSAEGKPQNGQAFALRPDLFFLTPRETASTNEEVELDFTVVAVESQSQEGKPLSDYGFVTLDGGSGKAIEAENCLVIQHPRGDYKKITLRDTRLLFVPNQPDADKHLFYESDTLEGSSGGLVIGLGTGEAIALHRASVPRLDEQGQVLRRDGRLWQPGDADDAIDWIANQGVRVSRLVDFITQAPISPTMAAYKNRLVAAMQRQETAAQSFPPDPLPILPASPPPRPAFASPASTVAPAGSNSEPAVDILVRVSQHPLLREHLLTTLRQQMPGIWTELIAADVPSYLRAYLVVTVPGGRDPWAVAAQLEALDGVEEAEPDLPRYLAATPADVAAMGPPRPRAWESSSGRSKWEEGDFLDTWLGHSAWLDGLDRNNPADLKEARRWSQRAVGYDAQQVAGQLGTAGLRTLADLRLVQFDTGYSDHSKVRAGYNLTADYDAVDDDEDARDFWQRGFVDFPGHGTRTASVLIGAADSQVPPDHEGNFGLLSQLRTDDYTVGARLIPFRVAKSVILLGSVKRLAQAVQLALDYGAQVLTMSMGTPLGSAVLADLARTVYERGVIWTCAAGNQVQVVVAPARYPGVICVAASNPADTPWPGSCYGPAVDITAPGGSVYVPILTDDGQEDMNYGDGTSFATPHVAAAALLWLAKNEQKIGTTYTQAWQRVEGFRLSLQRTARQAPGLPTDKFGAGILDIKALLELELPQPAELRHAYTNPSSLEKVADKRPLAVRELEYRDGQQVMANLLGRPTQERSILAGQPQEGIFAGLGALSARAQQWARALDSYAGGRRATGGLEATAGPDSTSGAAYARLCALQEMQPPLKPRYDSVSTSDLASNA